MDSLSNSHCVCLLILPTLGPSVDPSFCWVFLSFVNQPSCPPFSWQSAFPCSLYLSVCLCCLYMSVSRGSASYAYKKNRGPWSNKFGNPWTRLYVAYSGTRLCFRFLYFDYLKLLDEMAFVSWHIVSCKVEFDFLWFITMSGLNDINILEIGRRLSNKVHENITLFLHSWYSPLRQYFQHGIMSSLVSCQSYWKSKVVQLMLVRLYGTAERTFVWGPTFYNGKDLEPLQVAAGMPFLQTRKASQVEGCWPLVTNNSCLSLHQRLPYPHAENNLPRTLSDEWIMFNVSGQLLRLQRKYRRRLGWIS